MALNRDTSSLAVFGTEGTLQWSEVHLCGEDTNRRSTATVNISHKYTSHKYTSHKMAYHHGLSHWLSLGTILGEISVAPLTARDINNINPLSSAQQSVSFAIPPRCCSTGRTHFHGIHRPTSSILSFLRNLVRMSVHRGLNLVTSSSAFFKALATASRSRSCLHASRWISTGGQRYQSSKRDLYTAPAYRPHSLPESFSAPPRNTGIPDTSIVGPKPELNDIRPPPIPNSEDIGKQISDEAASLSLPESEAQKSSAVPASKSSTFKTADKKPQRTSKLKPRKAAISITQPALDHLRNLLEQPDPKMIRVGVKNRGCSGLAYHLEYVEKPGAFDEVVEQDGVKVLVDSKALFSIIGSEMDWQEDKLSTRFVFRNPNIKEHCGCGESFMV